MKLFNPNNKQSLTHAEALDPIWSITDKEDALQYKAAYVAHIQQQINRGEFDPRGESALEIANSNIGYWAGYGKNVERVLRLFETEHPIYKHSIKY